MKSLRHKLARLARCTEGSALVEMTIVFPILILLMIGSIDFGMAFSDDATIDKSVRDAGRYLASLPDTIYSTGCPTWALQNATNLVVYGKFPVSQSDRPLINGWYPNGPASSADNNVTITCTPTTIIVSAKAPYNTLMLSVFYSGAGTLTLSARHEEVVVDD